MTTKEQNIVHFIAMNLNNGKGLIKTINYASKTYKLDKKEIKRIWNNFTNISVNNTLPKV